MPGRRARGPRWRWVAAAGVALAAGLAGCVTGPGGEPPNLQPHKERVRAYVAEGDYHRAIAAVATQARDWLAQRAARGGARLAVVFDVDETLLSNWPSLAQQDFGYVPVEWQRWVEEARAPAIEPVRTVMELARRLGIEVVLITGRPERDRAATERNLRAAGCGDYTVLICQPDEARGTSAAFKTAERKKLVEAGRTIVANLGDQESDLAGGFAERTFKLPNPFYVTD